MLLSDPTWLLPRQHPRAPSNSFGAEDASGARPPKRQCICEVQKPSLSSVQVTLLKVVTESWVARAARLMQSNGLTSEELHGFTPHCLHAG